MKVYKVPAYWEMYGYMTVEANNPQEAWERAEKEKDTCALPYPAEYVDESFHIDRDGDLICVYENMPAKDVPVYYHNFIAARENNEAELYQQSKKLNSECVEAIDRPSVSKNKQPSHDDEWGER